MSGSQVLGGPSLIGETLAGRYDVLALLGRGGMGEVYEARDLVLGRRVAIKVLPVSVGSDERYLRRLRREARTAAALMHPNVVAVHDLGVDGGRAFIVMELVAGRRLADLIEDRAPLPPGRAAWLARQVAEALAYAHARGIVHRDIAPGNIMVTPEDTAKVLDFGIAWVERWTPAAGASPSPHGTIAYLAPEQIEGRPVDARTDIYALGCVLYEMLTGRPPFVGTTSAQVAAQHVRATPVPPRPTRPQISPALDDIVMRCLAKDPRERFPGARELAEALAEIERSAEPATQPIPSRAVVRSTTERLRPEPTEPISHTMPRPRPRRAVTAALAWVTAFVALSFLVVPVVRAVMWPSDADPLPPASRPLQPPTGVEAAGVCDGFLSARVEVTWTPASSAAVDGYEVYRSDASDGRYTLVASVPGRGANALADPARGLDTTYYYTVRAVDGKRLGPLTEPASAHTPLLCLG
jgi:serine/threonine-protein kinase